MSRASCLVLIIPMWASCTRPSIFCLSAVGIHILSPLYTMLLYVASWSLCSQYWAVSGGKSFFTSGHPVSISIWTIFSSSSLDVASANTSCCVLARVSAEQTINSSSITSSAFGISCSGNLLRQSANPISFPFVYINWKLYGWTFNIILCILIGAAWIGFFIRFSNGLWSDSIVKSDFPYINLWKRWHPKTMASISFSIWAYLCSVGVSALDAYPTTPLFCIMAAPSPLDEASTLSSSGFDTS